MIGPLENFETILASTDAWQTVTGAETAIAAKNFIHVYGIRPVPDPPFCLIKSDRYERRRTGYPSHADRGTIVCQFHLARPDLATIDLEARSILTTLQTLEDQLIALSGTVAGGATYLQIARLRIIKPRLSARLDDSPHWLCDFEVDWSV